MDVAPQLLAFTTYNQGRFAMRFPADEPEYGVDPRFLHLPRPVDVVLLVEPGLQLYDRRHLFAIFGSPPQRPDDRGVLPDPVKRLLDGEYIGILGCRVQKIHDHGKRIVGVVQEHVPLANDR